MDKIIFGDNQFFGINHMSLDKAASLSERFSKDKEIYDVLCMAREIGINTFMFTTHERFENVFNMIKKNDTFKDFKYIPCIPYAHKYANAITDMGIVEGIKKYIPGNLLLTGFKGATSLLTGEYLQIMKILIDSEMKTLQGLNVEALFLQNIVTDLLLGLGMTDIFEAYYEYVKTKYKIRAGIITMNHVKAEEVFVNKLKIEDIIICSPINKIGFRMNPDQESVENIIKKHKTSNIAMSIFASGAIPPREAIEYISKLKGIDSVLFGASTYTHIKSTYDHLTSNL